MSNTNKRQQEMNRKAKQTQDIQKTNSKLAYINLIISIIKLNVNGLNTSIKRQSVSVQIKK